MPYRDIISDSLREAGKSPLQHLTPVPGGSINQCFHCRLDDGQQLFAKVNTDASRDFFKAEAAGLRALASGTTLRTPGVMHTSHYCLLLEYLPPADPVADYWEQLAQGLAQMHRQPRPGFGFVMDNFCGRTPQPNGQLDNGYAFFAEQRLGFQLKLARSHGRLDAMECQRIETLASRLAEWIPEEAPRLLHGDLWSGNIHTDQEGQPALIDPACYWGWREADLAMTQLFGTLPTRFYDCYHEHLPLFPGWQERVDIYNLYHLLNHLNLFGSGYRRGIRAVLRRYVG